MAKRTPKSTKPQVNPDLDGFDININEFGEIISNLQVGKLNQFLDGRVDDKKFRGVDVVKREDANAEDPEPKTWG